MGRKGADLRGKVQLTKKKKQAKEALRVKVMHEVNGSWISRRDIGEITTTFLVWDWKFSTLDRT
jgi:hypothetical protein